MSAPKEPKEGSAPSHASASALTQKPAQTDGAEPNEPGPLDPSAADSENTGKLAAPAAPAVQEHASQASMVPTWSAILCVLLGGALPFGLMASESTLPGSVPLGGLGLLVAVFGLLRLTGALGKRAEVKSLATPITRLGAPLAFFVSTLIAHWAAVTGAVAGIYPAHQVTSAVLVSATAVAVVAGGYKLGKGLGVWESKDNPTQLTERGGFWLSVLAILLYLPMLGNFGLIDPWETHYGEVAREMLARDEWISLWWAQDGWFWSKPILNFWMQGLSFKLFGVQYMPGQMVASWGTGAFPQPEWAARLPLFWFTLLATHLLYKATAVSFGKRVGFAAGLILLTSPYWYFLTRQTMADMPYVAPVTAAMALLLLGFQTDPDKRVKLYRFQLGKRHLDLHLGHLVMLAIAMVVLPQVLYLLTRNLTLHLGDPFGFRPHLDQFMQGSGGGNCGLPGNKKCSSYSPVGVWRIGEPASLQPALWGVVYLFGLLGFLLLQRKEQRLQRWYFLSAWFATALAVMAKGAPGMVLPLVTALGFVVVSGRFRDLLRLELPSLLLLILIVTLPWYLQMLMRHGKGFLDRLILHDMYKRAFKHVHDTNKGDDVSFRYYLWQLGYGLFPWTGLSAAGLLWWIRADRDKLTAQTNAWLLLWVWWLAAFGMFTITLTKFHHYILPLVPPTAVMAAAALVQFWPKRLPQLRWQAAAYIASQLASALLLVVGVALFFQGNILGFAPDGERSPGSYVSGIFVSTIGLVGFSACVRWLGRWQDNAPNNSEDTPTSKQEASLAIFSPAALGVIALASSFIVALCARDLLVTFKGDVEGQARLMHLFTYNYTRSWPKTVDFTAALAGFGIVSAAALAFMSVTRWRKHIGVLFSSVAVWWAVWGVSIYLVQLSPHWGQRENLLAYYEHRESNKEPFVAYQMNWKGENFYTGNQMATWVSSGKKFKKWIKKQRRNGVETMFFTTEFSRTKTLKRELGNPKDYEELTDKASNNKFVLVRVNFGPLPPEPKKKKSKKRKKKKTESEG